MACRGICQRYKASFNVYKGGHYAQGHSRCNHKCNIFIKWDGKNCPCCGMRLKKGKSRTYNPDSSKQPAAPVITASR